MAHPLEDVGAETAAALAQVIDNDEAARDLAAVTDAFGDQHTMIDDARERAAVVPHEGVERRHMHQQAMRIIEPVASIGWMSRRRIVLQVDSRQVPLLLREKFILIDLVVLPRLEQHAVESQIAH
jgi:hypothetical protein